MKKQNKKIILIGGTSYSGSTMLDLMLGNDKNGFSTGEYRGFLSPRKLHHLNVTFISEDSKKLWRKIKEKGLKKIYKTIFNEKPEVDFIIDSTKNVFWLKEMEKIAKNDGYDVKHLLLWKTPEEFAYSCYKRNKLENSTKIWIKYYRLYFTYFKDFSVVKYHSLVNDDKYLNEICSLVGIPFFDKKKNFWEKESFALGGNRSAKIHLYDAKSPEFNYTINTIVADKIDNEVNINKKLHKIYYDEDKDFLNMFNSNNQLSDNQYLIKIKKVLEKYNSLSKSESDHLVNNLSFNKFEVMKYYIYMNTKIIIQKIKLRFLES